VLGQHSLMPRSGYAARLLNNNGACMQNKIKLYVRRKVGTVDFFGLA